MRHVLAGLVLSILVCAAPAPAEAREVVEFVDGRYLEIRSYTVQGDLIRLDVGRGSFLVIPVASVDEIRRDWLIVFSTAPETVPVPQPAWAYRSREAADPDLPEPSPSIRELWAAGLR